MVVGLVLATLIAGVTLFFVSSSPVPAPASSPSPGPAGASDAVPNSVPVTYVGAETCKTCHESEFKAWSGSHHQLAMQEATASSVLGDFANAKFKKDGVESTFFKRGDKFMVRTDGADGKLADFEIAYTFGVYPLQQYLIAFPGGRYQVLPIAWDSRPKEAGGQRWFHLQPDEKIGHKDPLHWTGRLPELGTAVRRVPLDQPAQGLRRDASQTYNTTFSEINVACESCHGQGSRPRRRGPGRAKPPYRAGDDKGLPSLASRWKEDWKFPRPTQRNSAVRDSAGRPGRHEQLRRLPRAPLDAERRPRPRRAAGRQPSPGDAHRAQLPRRRPAARRGLCLGLVPAEQDASARRHLHGLPRAARQKLRAEGNALCTRCHAAASVRFAGAPSPPYEGSKGAQCVTCHMPTQNYMVIHARQDHSLRIPRPDLSLTLGSPNACTQCHTDRSRSGRPAPWISGTARPGANARTTVQHLHAGETQGHARLTRPARTRRQSDGAGNRPGDGATLAQPHANPGTLPAAQALLQRPDPSVRIAALGMLATAEMTNRVPWSRAAARRPRARRTHRGGAPPRRYTG
jgi:hypothetical protein